LFFRILLVAIALASVATTASNDADRVHSLTTKVFCNCGCGEVLSECSHSECKAKGPMKQKVASWVQSGKTDDDILGELEKEYGATILVVPSFRGFNILLWAVPVGAGLVALAIFVWRRRAVGHQA